MTRKKPTPTKRIIKLVRDSRGWSEEIDWAPIKKWFDENGHWLCKPCNRYVTVSRIDRPFDWSRWLDTDPTRERMAEK